MGEDKEPGITREEIFKVVQSLTEEVDLFAASEYVLSLGNEPRIVEAFSNLVADCHHKAKSTEQVLHFGHAGVHYCLARAIIHDRHDAAAARELRFASKRMATNIASFTWPGWNEPGVTISPEQMGQGLTFARYSVRQLNKLGPNADQLAFTYWFLAAQLIAHGEYDEALKVLEQAKNFSNDQDDNPDDVTMLEGYIGLTRVLNGQQDIGEAAFASAVAVLKSRENNDARLYAQQLVNVRAFFEQSCR